MSTLAHIASIIAMMTIVGTSAQTSANASRRAKSVPINDQVLAGGQAFVNLPEKPEYAVDQVDGKYVVVVRYWNTFQKKMVVGSTVQLDSNNQFQPNGMRWKFTLTPDGYLTWTEVIK